MGEEGAQVAPLFCGEVFGNQEVRPARSPLCGASSRSLEALFTLFRSDRPTGMQT